MDPQPKVQIRSSAPISISKAHDLLSSFLVRQDQELSKLSSIPDEDDHDQDPASSTENSRWIADEEILARLRAINDSLIPKHARRNGHLIGKILPFATPGADSVRSNADASNSKVVPEMTPKQMSRREKDERKSAKKAAKETKREKKREKKERRATVETSTRRVGAFKLEEDSAENAPVIKQAEDSGEEDPVVKRAEDSIPVVKQAEDSGEDVERNNGLGEAVPTPIKSESPPTSKKRSREEKKSAKKEKKSAKKDKKRRKTENKEASKSSQGRLVKEENVFEFK